MPKAATASKGATKRAAKPAAKSGKVPTAAPAAVPKVVKKAAPAPAIKQNAAAVKADVKKIKAEAKADKSDKPRKPKLVRDSFTMPADEYAVLGDVKKACLKAGMDVKKSELLRVGVALIRQLDLTKLKGALAALPVLKAGRPKKHK